MRYFILMILGIYAVYSADIVSVDPAGVTTITGVAPATTPASGEVKIGGGQVLAEGSVTAGDVVIKRAAQATGAQAVRGDDVRLTAHDVKYFTISGNFTVPEGVTRIFVKVWGGGGNGGSGGDGGGAGGFAHGKMDVSPGQVISVTVGAATQMSGVGGVITANGGVYRTGGTAVGNIFQRTGDSTSSKVGASSPFGGGGGVLDGTYAGTGSFPGGGGSGGAKTTDSRGNVNNHPGGTGAPGLVIIEW